MSAARKRVLLTGATGFVGSHVHPLLVERGFDVVGGTRKPQEASARAPRKAFCYIDLEDPASVRVALQGFDAVVYLVHSVGHDAHYERMERNNAETLRAAAAEKKLERIVYLGGPRPRGKVSKHLRSRLETGRVLREGTVPTVELQASMIVGGGSESFRIVRDLAARLPWMILPRWLQSRTEPVAIADVAEAIAHALAMPLEASRVLGVPGPECMSGREILERTARAFDQEPYMLDVPLVTPRLSTYWIRLVTRANPALARELVEGMRSDIIADGESIWSQMPDYERVSFDEAVMRALREEAETLPAKTRLVESLIHRVASEPAVVAPRR